MPQFVEQPRVLDGDDSLGGKILYQRDLLVGEGADFLAIHGECADQFVVLSSGTANFGSHAPESRRPLLTRQSRAGVISGLRIACNSPLCAISRAGCRASVDTRRFGLGEIRQRQTVRYALRPMRNACHPGGKFSTPNAASQMRVAFFQHGLENRLQARPGRTADDLSTSGGCRLLFSNNSVRSVVRWRNSFSSRAFSMAMTAWTAKFWSNAICLSEMVDLCPHIPIEPINSLSLSIGTAM